jgi:Right handed beta helix region
MASDLLRFALVMITALCVSGVSAGDLNPPGAPGPTLIAGLPVATPITSVPVTIEESGVYYLTDSFSVASEFAHGITVRADDVVIDLAGHSLIGPGTGTGRAVSAEDSDRTTVRNGTVREFGGTGVVLGDSGTAEDLQIEDCRAGLGVGSGGSARRVNATRCELLGIQVIRSSGLTDCTVTDCDVGIIALVSSVTRCSVLQSESVGILALAAVVVSDCTVIGASEDGFRGSGGAVFEGCSATMCGTGFDGEGGVTIRSCTATQCSVEGIAVAGSEGSSLIADCHVEDASIGIRVNQAANVMGNFVNNASTEGIQISADTTDVTVLDNVLMNTPSAIHHLGLGDNCLYARNTYTSGVNLGQNATWGPLVTGSGNLNDDIGSDNPWANIHH